MSDFYIAIQNDLSSSILFPPSSTTPKLNDVLLRKIPNANEWNQIEIRPLEYSTTTVEDSDQDDYFGDFYSYDTASTHKMEISTDSSTMPSYSSYADSSESSVTSTLKSTSSFVYDQSNSNITQCFYHHLDSSATVINEHLGNTSSLSDPPSATTNKTTRLNRLSLAILNIKRKATKKHDKLSNIYTSTYNLHAHS
ncbi:hypothetical protein BDB01DRAFT_846663 [Pilobolus umbonatus]|nr:hypothetical protein BDB01DRAFT_846663 [Pilobolus umbonatus]